MKQLKRSVVLEKELESTTVPKATRELLCEVVRDLHSTEDNLRNKAREITNRVQNCVSGLEQGFHINELGVLQGNALDFDRLCALRQSQADMAKRIAFVIAEVHGVKVEVWA